MILCDTNIFIEIYRGNDLIVKEISELGQHNIAVSDITCAELLYGARNKKELQIIRKDLNKLTILPINSSISTSSVELIEKYSISHKLSLPDAFIAATAIYHDFKLYTLNVKDFKYITGIKMLMIKD
jgi:predicted nucleic acid-binding protein